jgi:stage V sporulation protein S
MEFHHNSADNDAGPPIFNVSASTVPLVLAKAITKVLRKQDRLDLQAIGAGAIYRATLALSIARVLLAEEGLGLVFTPMFAETTGDETTLVGVIFEVEYRPCTGIPPIIPGRS